MVTIKGFAVGSRNNLTIIMGTKAHVMKTYRNARRFHVTYTVEGDAIWNRKFSIVTIGEEF